MADEERSEFGTGLEAALEEVRAYRRGELALPTQRVGAMPAERVKSIRKAVSSSTRDFEKRFHIPARTVEGWEHGKKLDTTASVLLRVIEQDPKAVEAALASALAEADGAQPVNDDGYAEALEHA